MSGFSVLELLIALGISMILLVFGGQNLLNIQELHKSVQDRAVMTSIEENVKRAILFNLPDSTRKNAALKNCLTTTGKCRVKRTRFSLYQGKNIVSGRYNANGGKCREGFKKCPMMVAAYFTPICKEGKASCDVARSFFVDYKIFLGKTPIKKGSLRTSNFQKTVSDVNFSCDVDSRGITRIAKSIDMDRSRNNKISCLDAPKIEAKVTGITPKDCLPNQELLVGFTAAGAAICEPINLVGDANE